MFTSKSMQINGAYLEDLIDGYTTVSATGRESIETELTTAEIGNRDGSVYQRKRFLSRTITVSFTIEGERDNLWIKYLKTYPSITDYYEEEVTNRLDYYKDPTDYFYYSEDDSEYIRCTSETVYNPELTYYVVNSNYNYIDTDGRMTECSSEDLYDPNRKYFLENEYLSSENSLLEKTRVLSDVLDVEEATFIFDDEPDVFYVGTVNGLPEIEFIQGVARGSFEILCSDPFKYSVDETVSEAIYNDATKMYEFKVNYDGTYKAYPYFIADFYSKCRNNLRFTQCVADDTFDNSKKYYSINEDGDYELIYDGENQSESPMTEEDFEDVFETDKPSFFLYNADDESINGDEDESITAGVADTIVSGDCGYVAFFDDEENILQFGNPEEADTAEIPGNPVLTTNSFVTSNSYNETIQDSWKPNLPYLPSTIGGLAFQMPSNSGMYNDLSTFQSYPGSYTYTGYVPKTKASSTTKPVCTYGPVKCVVDNRKADSVKLTFTIPWVIPASGQYKTKTEGKGKKKKKVKYATGSYLKKGSVLTAGVLVNGTWHETTIKKATSDIVNKKLTGTATISFTISDISANTQELSGVKFRVSRSGGSGSAGRLTAISCKNIEIPRYAYPSATGYYLTGSPGTPTRGGASWFGPTMTRTLPAFKKLVDGEEETTTGADNWSLNFDMYLACGKNPTDVKQRGGIYVAVLTNTQNNPSSTQYDRVLASCFVYRPSDSGNGKVQFWTCQNGTVTSGGVKEFSEAFSYHNSLFGSTSYSASKSSGSGSGTASNKFQTFTGPTIAAKAKKKKKKTKAKKSKKKKKVTKKASTKKVTYTVTPDNSCSIVKSGNTVKFTLAGLTETITLPQADANRKAYKVMVGFFGYMTTSLTHPFVEFCGMKSIKFTALQGGGVYDCKNAFKRGDVLTVDTETGEVYLGCGTVSMDDFEGELATNLGALGNDWDNFYLTPGENNIGIGYSDWSYDFIYEPGTTFTPYITPEYKSCAELKFEPVMSVIFMTPLQVPPKRTIYWDNSYIDITGSKRAYVGRYFNGGTDYPSIDSDGIINGLASGWAEWKPQYYTRNVGVDTCYIDSILFYKEKVEQMQPFNPDIFYYTKNDKEAKIISYEEAPTGRFNIGPLYFRPDLSTLEFRLQGEYYNRGWIKLPQVGQASVIKPDEFSYTIAVAPALFAYGMITDVRVASDDVYELASGLTQEQYEAHPEQYYTSSMTYYELDDDEYVPCEVNPTEDEYRENPSNYVVAKKVTPEFTMKYREVYI